MDLQNNLLNCRNETSVALLVTFKSFFTFLDIYVHICIHIRLDQYINTTILLICGAHMQSL